VHQLRKGICNGESCRRTAILEEQADKKRARAAAFAREGEAWLLHLRSRFGERIDPMARLALLPAADGALAKLAERRKQAFRTRLRQLVNETAAEPDDGSTTESDAATEANPVLQQACATCRGYCCRRGGEHAFLRVATVRSYLRAHPAAGADDVVADYAGRLPAVSYRGSCVFHSERGCSLPREMRSSICNDFLCDGLADLRRQLGEAPLSAFAVAGEPGDLRRAALFDAQRTRLDFRRRPRRRAPDE